MRALVLVLLLLSAAVGGCVDERDDETGRSSTSEPERVPPSVWRADLSAERYPGIVSSLHYLDAADGTRLSLTLHLPDGLPADAQIPTLLELTPYQPLNPAISTPATGTGGPSFSFREAVLRGAAVVIADARGTGGSEGCLDFGGSADRADARTFIDWIREQSWSNGRIVTDGVSHPGMGSVVAHAASEHLTAALTHAPVVSYYQDEWLQGARFEDQFNGAAYQGIELAPPVYTDPDGLAAQAATCTGETARDFNALDGRFTELWDDRHLARHNEAGVRAETPILLTHGFVDLNVHPDHTQLYWDALPADHPKWLIMGWWYHGWPDMDGHPVNEFQDIRHRWLDATLFEHDNGLWAEPRVLVEDSQGTWHESHDWPLDGSEDVLLQPAGDGTLGIDPSRPPAAAEISYDDNGPTTRGRWTDSHVAFRTDPLDAARLVNGAPVVELVGTSDETATKWVAYLLDEAPDGTWQRITHGYADSHTWAGEDQWEPMEPERLHNWTLRLMPTAVVVEAGHRIVLLITSQDSRQLQDPDEEPYCFDDHRGGCYDPSGIVPADTAGQATNRVLVAAEGTTVHLQWVDPTTTARPLTG